MVTVGCLVTIIADLLLAKKMCISPHAPRKQRQIAEVHVSLQICGSSFWNLLHVTLVALRSWRWLLDFSENLWIPDIHQSELEFYIKSAIKVRRISQFTSTWESTAARPPKLLERNGFLPKFRAVNISRNKEILNSSKMR